MPATWRLGKCPYPNLLKKLLYTSMQDFDGEWSQKSLDRTDPCHAIYANFLGEGRRGVGRGVKKILFRD